MDLIETLLESVQMIAKEEDSERKNKWIENFRQVFEKEGMGERFDEELNRAIVEHDRNTGKSFQEVSTMLDHKREYAKDGSVSKSKIMQTVRNHETVLLNDERFAGRIRFDEFAGQIYLVGNVPWTTDTYRPWTSSDDSVAFGIIQSEYGLTSRNDYFDAISNAANSYRFHPVRDLLSSLQWDGQEHIRGLLPAYLGCEDSLYNYEIMKLFMFGAINRVFHPGCKFDYTLIFQGAQGLGKSSFLRALAMSDDWYNDSLDSLDGDRAVITLMGSWICELGELKAISKTVGGIEAVKRFLTAQSDKIRLPYQRRAEIIYRQNVFAGTTNKLDFLSDTSGNRRFIIVKTDIQRPTKNVFDPEITDDIRGAWAQAMDLYKSGNYNLVLPDSVKQEAELLQEDALSDSGETGLIRSYLADKTKVCVLQIWQECLMENGRPTRYQSSEINDIISGTPGWKRLKSPISFGIYGKQRGFYNDEKTPFD